MMGCSGGRRIITFTICRDMIEKSAPLSPARARGEESAPASKSDGAERLVPDDAATPSASRIRKEGSEGFDLASLRTQARERKHNNVV